jgi:Phytanoyl-CoA dioxygenase (PhyH)
VLDHATPAVGSNGTVSSNGVSLPFTAELFAPMRDSRDAVADPAELRHRLRAEGYLYLPGVLDPDEVRQLRRDYFASFPAGSFAAGSDLDDGVPAVDPPVPLPPHGVAGHPAHAFVRGDRFRDFLDQPFLRELAAVLLEGEVARLPRAILRHFPGGSARSSRAHTDHDYMDRGSGRVLTAWIPAGDCPVRGGGLVYLENCDGIGQEQLDALRSVSDRPHDHRPISHDLGFVARQLGRRWLCADYRAGDIAVHTPWVVHAALDTRTRAARVSVDVRFVRRDAAPDARWDQPWAADDGA